MIWWIVGAVIILGIAGFLFMQKMGTNVETDLERRKE